MTRDEAVGTLAQQAYQLIRDKMLRGVLPMGTPLSRRKLAKEFAMSVVPVSEALRQLQDDGFVESWPRVGTRVRKPTVNDIRDLFVVREALEVQAGRLFAAKATRAEREQLKKMAADVDLRSQQRALGGGDSEKYRFEYHQQHVRFHLRIAECTGSRALCQTIEKTNVMIFHWFYDALLRAGNNEPSGGHKRLVKAVASGDVRKAEAAVRLHLRTGLGLILSSMEPLPDIGGRYRTPYSITKTAKAMVKRA